MPFRRERGRGAGADGGLSYVIARKSARDRLIVRWRGPCRCGPEACRRGVAAAGSGAGVVPQVVPARGVAELGNGGGEGVVLPRDCGSRLLGRRRFEPRRRTGREL